MTFAAAAAGPHTVKIVGDCERGQTTLGTLPSASDEAIVLGG